MLHDQNDENLSNLRAAFEKARKNNDSARIHTLIAEERKAVRHLPLPDRYDYFLGIAVDLWGHSDLVIDRKIRRDANSDDVGIKTGFLELNITAYRILSPEIANMDRAAEKLKSALDMSAETLQDDGPVPFRPTRKLH